MPIEVVCQCGKRFAARDDLAGKTVACPGCRAPLSIAAPRRPAAVAEPSGVSSILDEIGLKSDGQGIVCPKCQNRILPGMSVCGRCNYNLQTASVQTKTQAAPSTAGNYDWKRLRAPESTTGSVVDEELTLGDMVMCGLLGCLVFPYGLILFVRGRSKGIMIMLGSLLLPLILAVIYVMFKLMLQTPPPKKAVQLPRPVQAIQCEVETV